jgi:osomolarity two-component system sensor histidine kinase TcsA
LCYQLQVTPILEGSSLIYVVLEAHDITHWTWTNHLQESSGAHEWYHWYRPNPEGKGSVFWFTVKMDRSEIASTVKKSYASTSDGSENLMGKVRAFAPRKHILLVEDNLVNHTVMLKLLQSLGFERIDAAWNGAEAVQMVKQTPLSYNMILMDISMPVLDGLEATSQIRSMDVDVPIVALTANALKGDAETYFATGMNDYIGKPVHRNQLLRVLWKWMGT